MILLLEHGRPGHCGDRSIATLFELLGRTRPDAQVADMENEPIV